MKRQHPLNEAQRFSDPSEGDEPHAKEEVLTSAVTFVSDRRMSHPTMDIEQQFVGWLKDAYFMEIHYAKALDEHLGAAKDYPRLHRLIEEHLWATTSHA